MSDINNQNQNNIIPSIREPSIESKTSLELLNKKLKEIHKNILKESSSKNVIKSLLSNEIEQNKNNIEDDNNDEEIKKEDKISEKKEEKENTINTIENENNENNDINNINKIKNSNDYTTSNDINLINNYGIRKKETGNEININESKNGEKNINKDEKKEELTNVTNNKTKNKEYVFKDSISNLTESNIYTEELIAYNISQGSELYLNEIIDKLGGEEEEVNNPIKEDELNSINTNQNIINEIDSNSVKIDSKEEIKLALTNIPSSDERDNASQLTNELNKAYIKSKDCISNIESDIPREDEKDETKKIKKFSKKNTKNSNNEKKTGLDIFFNNKEPKKDEHILIKEIKKEIYNEINNLEEKKLNLVKINNKEKYSYITKYNDPDKEKLGYEPDYYYCNKNSKHFINRRNNFLNHKYFSYILSKKNYKNINQEEKGKKNKNKDKKKDDSFDINDNYEYKEEEIKKFKKNYNEEFEPMEFNLNFIRANTQRDDIKEYKINDVEDMTSFYYYFKLYSPEEDFQKILDEETENEIISSFTTYRKVLNDGNSLKRAFSYLLLESFILQNQTKKLEFIIYDIKRTIGNKFKEIKNIFNILIDIKENSSIDYLMNSYNNPNFNFDEVMVTYIEDTIKNVMGQENNKRKYQEIDYNVLKILANIFEVNLEIYYIEEDNNKLLKMRKLEIFNETFIKEGKKNDCDSSTTFRLLFFLNSFYIVYTKKSDIDSTLANNNTEKEYYYIDTLPKYKCPTCKKNTGLDIIPSYEAIFCHICLTRYLQVILEKRAILFVKSNFSCIEYYTRPIKITSDIIINFSIYKYITKNYIIMDFENIIEKICFKCFGKFEKDKINKLKCMCQLCDNCLEKLLKENLKDKVCPNKYELHTIEKTKCLCQNDVDLINLMELSKNKPSKKDKNKSEERLLKELRNRCCLCQKKDRDNLFEVKIIDRPPHMVCLNCDEVELSKKEDLKISDKNEINNNFDLTDHESNDTAIKEKNVIKKRIFCKICYEEHICILNNKIGEENKKNLIERVAKIGGNKFRCCQGKCNIY